MEAKQEQIRTACRYIITSTAQIRGIGELECLDERQSPRNRFSHSKNNSYFMECNPIILPSVSNTSAMKPYLPMDIFSLKILPPCSAARAASAAQSSHLK